MRALHLVKTAVGATWAQRLMKQLVSLDTHVHVAIPDGPLVEGYRTAGISTHELQTNFPLKQPWRFPSLAKQFRDLVQHVQPDVIHSHFVGTTLTMRLALGRNSMLPRIFQVAGPLHLENTVFRRAELSTAGPRDYWIASCEWTRRKYFESGIAPERTFLSYYGVDLSSLQRGSRGTLRRELGLPASMQIVGMVAYMYPPKRYLGQRTGLKGHEDLIDALALIREKRNDVVGVFVGGAWGDALSYEHKVRAHGRRRCGNAAVFLGTRSDIAELYSDIDVAVHPSHSENLGGALESLALGVPTIATDVGGLPDLVVENQTGWLVPARNPQRLAEAIVEALSDHRRAKSMAKRGRERVMALCDLTKTAKEVREAYDSILL